MTKAKIAALAADPVADAQPLAPDTLPPATGATASATPPPPPPPVDPDAPPRQADVATMASAQFGRLRVVDPATGETISHVRGYDQDAGTLTRMKIADGNLVREGDHFATVVEERAFRVEWIAGEVVA